MSSEIAVLHQSTLTNSLHAASNKKRTLISENGDEIDLLHTDDVNVKPETVRALKLRIIQLEDELAARPAPVKRVRKSAASAVDATYEESAPVASSSNTAAATSNSTKADEKKRKIHLKKIFDRVKKECKLETCKFQGGMKTVKFDEIFDVAEFETLFSGTGNLIQPTPNNKPKSAVTIISYNKTQIEAFFGSELKALKGTRWSRGGVPQGGGFFGGGGGFSKSIKQGSVDVEIQSCNVTYSKNGMKCSLKFDVAEARGGGGYGGGYDSDGW